MTDTGSYEKPRRPKVDPLPWVLFGAITLVLGSTSLVLGLRLRQANERIEAEYGARASAEQQRLAAEKAAAEAQAKVAALEAQARDLSAQRDALAARARVVEVRQGGRPAAKAAVRKKASSKRRRR